MKFIYLPWVLLLVGLSIVISKTLGYLLDNHFRAVKKRYRWYIVARLFNICLIVAATVLTVIGIYINAT